MSTRILLGLVLGLVAGSLIADLGLPARDFGLAVTSPIGSLWLNALTMTVVPLVFGLLVTGIGSASSTAAAGGVTGRAIVWIIVLLVAACALSAVLTTLLIRLAPPMGAGLLSNHAGSPPDLAQPASWFEGIVPSNPIKAAADMAIAPLVVFALFFGFAATRIEAGLRAALMTFFEAVVATMLVIVRWVLLAGPVGVAALGFGVGAKMGLSAAGALVHYVAIVVAACLAVTGAAYVLAVVVGRAPFGRFFRAALPVQAVALGTQSSLACLPAMVTAASALGVPSNASNVVLPLAVSIFRAASAAANIAVAVYLAHLHGVAIAPATLIIGVLVAAAVSLAAVGLPAQVSFFATIGPVCLAMGVPLDLLPVLLAIETIPDIFRTLGNVTSDLALARVTTRTGESPSRQVMDAGGSAPIPPTART